jgi:N4-gp56 family major capsid protein
MATMTFGVNDPLAVKLWSKKLAVEALKDTYFGRFLGETSDSLIQIKTETAKGAGDKITVGLRMQLSGAGVAGDGTLEGNEEALVTYSDAVVLDQLRHAVRSSGRASQQRVPFDLRQESLDGMKDWWADRLDTGFFNQICGYTVESDTRLTGNQAAVAPDAAHQKWGGAATNDQGLGSSDIFKLSLIDKCVEAAKTLSPAIRPMKHEGRDFYVMFLHPYQVTDLRTDAATAGNWLDIQKAAMQGGKVVDNPIFTGALGVYNGVVLHEATRVTQGIHSSTGAAVANTRRAVFCGAQAAMIAFGQDSGPNKFTWVEELFDLTAANDDFEIVRIAA